MTVYVPILTFQRIEGKLFRPMAVTISLAVIGALVLTLTLIPVLMSLLFRRPPSERESPLLRRRAPEEQRSEEHTSELQSHSDLVCRLLLEKKKMKNK